MASWVIKSKATGHYLTMIDAMLHFEPRPGRAIRFASKKSARKVCPMSRHKFKIVRLKRPRPLPIGKHRAPRKRP